MFKRFFAFGCSFTHYAWPTWADIMAWDLDVEFQNWGIGGLGNVGIFHRLVECDLKNKFNDDDLIVVLWSHWNREDRYLNGGWKAHGNIFHNDLYDRYFIKKYWSLENDIIKNSTAIISANRIANINFQAHIYKPGAFESDSKKYSDYEDMLRKFYRQFYPSNDLFPSDLIHSYNKNYTDPCKHPSILLHLLFLKDYVYPKLGFTLKPSTEILCNNIEQDIVDSFKSSMSFGERYDLICDVVRNKYKLNFGKRYGF